MATERPPQRQSGQPVVRLWWLWLLLLLLLLLLLPVLLLLPLPLPSPSLPLLVVVRMLLFECCCFCCCSLWLWFSFSFLWLSLLWLLSGKCVCMRTSHLMQPLRVQTFKKSRDHYMHRTWRRGTVHVHRGSQPISGLSSMDIGQ